MSRLRRAAPLVSALAVAVVLAELLSGGALRDALASAALTVHRDRYTSLELVDHTQVPTTVMTGEVLAFHVRLVNHQGSPTVYTVSRDLADSDGRPATALPPAEMALRDGQVGDIPVALAVPQCTGRMRAEVALAGRTETVRIWITARSESPAVRPCA